MGRQNGRSLVLLTTIFILIGLMAPTMAYVPDGIIISEQPETIDADGESVTQITAQLMADLDEDGNYDDVVKMCGIEVTCESQDPDVLNNGLGGATLTGWTDEFGKVSFDFQSTGSEGYNEGEVEVICRALQLEEGSSFVKVETKVATHFHVTKCPDSDYEGSTDGQCGSTPQTADIIADGSSHVYITAQLKNELQNPVHKEGWVRFKSMDTVFVKTCAAPGTGINSMGYEYKILDTGVVLVKTDKYGVAIAEFCSAGSGSENVGVAEIHIESVDFPNVEMAETCVGTTNQFGTTYKDGFLAMSVMADQIMADEESCATVCAQTRDQDYRIIKKSGWQVLFESEDTSLAYASPWASDTDHGLAFATTNVEGIATYKFCSAGDFDKNNVGEVYIRGSAPTIVEEAGIILDLRTEQIWPTALEVKPTMPIADCDGESTVTVTAQLLDRYGLATKMANRLVTFKSQDTTKLKNPNGGGAIINAYTDAFGKAHATFITTDCKNGGNYGDVEVTVSTQSPAVQESATVEIVKPRGFVPDGVSVYTDQNVRGYDTDNPAHAKPYVISADGVKPTYVTAQVCEDVVCDEYNTKESCNDVPSGCKWYEGACVRNTEEPIFCNPVKRCGVEIEFKVLDNTVVQNKGTDNADPSGENGVDYVKLYTDCEGKATAVFRSTGDAPSNKEKCTLIQVDAKNGELIGTAYSQVCTKGEEGTYPNTIWVWADPSYITADGTSHTTLRAALFDCYQNFPELPSWINVDVGELNQNQNGQGYWFLYDNCKPVQMPGVTVKFETMNTDALDDGMGGYKMYDLTDQFGQAHVTFQSKGFDTQHMGDAEIKVFTIGSGENVVQLNKLIIGLEEKTWPWCPPLTEWFGVGTPESTADVDNDQYITDNELIEYIMNVWMMPYDAASNPFGNDDFALVQVINAWLTQTTVVYSCP